MAIVLICGQDAATIEAASAAIEGLRHRVLLVDSSLDVVMEAVDHEAALVVLEERMPIFDGYEVAAQLRADPSVPAALPILLLADSDIDTRKLMEVGVTESFMKSGDSARLADLIVGLLGDAASPEDDVDTDTIKSLGL